MDRKASTSVQEQDLQADARHGQADELVRILATIVQRKSANEPRISSIICGKHKVGTVFRHRRLFSDDIDTQKGDDSLPARIPPGGRFRTPCVIAAWVSEAEQLPSSFHEQQHKEQRGFLGKSVEFS